MPSTVHLEPRTDCPEMQDGLQSRIHDPLWFLARQWQFGEFKGDDAGSPAAAQLVVKSAPISRFHPGPLPSDSAQAIAHAKDYSPLTVPLEALVEREPVRRLGLNNFRLAAEAGLHLPRTLEAQGMGTYRSLFLKAYPLKFPAEDERQALDDDTLRFLEVVAGRAIDGLALYTKLAQLRQGAGLAKLFTEAPFNEIRNEDRPRILQAMTVWLTWYEALFSQSNDNPSWVQERLEYSFAVSGQTSAGETVLNAPEYLEGHLDWFSFVVDPIAKLGAAGQISSVTSSFLPMPVSFRGMPSPRLWEFEDAKVNFGRVEADTQDLARLLLVHFALEYGNDWFVVPVEVEAGCLCRIGALIVMNTFGERMLIAHTSEVDGLRSPWRMFALSPDPRSANETDDPGTAAKLQGLFFLPPALGVSLQGAALEEVLLLRDEMANLAWAVERVVESPIHRPLDRFEAFQERRRRQERAGDSNSDGHSASAAELTYRLGTSVPDYWIPLLPVQNGSEIRLRRGSLPRTGSGTFEGTFEPQGLILDPGHELLLHDEEV
ncbi:MAG: hypothetical protein L0338_01760, partial [Acidobacteria bacterium]|nr:hypothetical protein [Acidobacteriota bacterium]